VKSMAFRVRLIIVITSNPIGIETADKKGFML
jgi:hypothetical protein